MNCALVSNLVVITVLLNPISYSNKVMHYTSKRACDSIIV